MTPESYRPRAEIPNSKLQIPNKFQSPISNDPLAHPSPLRGEGWGKGISDFTIYHLPSAIS